MSVTVLLLFTAAFHCCFSLQPPKVKSVKRTKKVAATPYVAKQAPKKETNPLIEKRPKNFGIGEIN